MTTLIICTEIVEYGNEEMTFYEILSRTSSCVSPVKGFALALLLICFFP